MNFFSRAIKYIVRKKNKTILLGLILSISVFVCAFSVVTLRETEEMLGEIAITTRANVSIFIPEFQNTIPQDEVIEIAQMANIYKVYKLNYFQSILADYLIVGEPEAIWGLEFEVQGHTDYLNEGPFFLNLAHHIKGSLELNNSDILVNDILFNINNWELGIELPFLGYDKEIHYLRIAGVYQLDPSNFRGSLFQIYGTTEMVNRLQGASLYNFVVFYVVDPTIIQETRVGVEELLSTLEASVNIQDTLFQQLSFPLLNVQWFMEIMLLVVSVTSIGIISLLLSLWMRERKHEVALLFAVGEGKLSVVLQRVVEVTIIFMAALLAVMFIGSYVMPHIGNWIFSSFNVADELGVISFSFLFIDYLYLFLVGGGIIFLSVLLSSLPLFKTMPKDILSDID